MTKAAKITLISSTILLLLLLTTNPQHLPSVALVAPFLLLFTLVTAAVAHLLDSLNFLKQHKVRVGIACASIPVLLLVLQSLGQLTVRDTLAIFVLFGVAYFYMSRFGVRPVS